MFTLNVDFSDFARKRSVKPAVSDLCFADWRICDTDWRNFVPDKKFPFRTEDPPIRNPKNFTNQEPVRRHPSRTK